jgi:hypothetical protein
MPASFSDPRHWRNRAKEARALAQQMDDPEAKRASSQLPIITNGSPREPKNARQVAGHKITTADNSARLPSGLLALASVRLHIRHDQAIGHPCLQISDHRKGLERLRLLKVRWRQRPAAGDALS